MRRAGLNHPLKFTLAAIKFARGATGRNGIVNCDHSYHGLTYGALSLTDDENFQGGFGPLLPGVTTIPFNDLDALERVLSKRETAAFIVEPIQGKGVNMPTDEFLPGAMAQAGLGYDHLRGINPKLVQCSITAYGQDGPYRDWPGHDPMGLAVAGLFHLASDPRDVVVCAAGSLPGDLHKLWRVRDPQRFNFRRRSAGVARELSSAMTLAATHPA